MDLVLRNSVVWKTRSKNDQADWIRRHRKITQTSAIIAFVDQPVLSLSGTKRTDVKFARWKKKENLYVFICRLPIF